MMQKDLSAALDIHFTVVSRWCLDKNTPTEENKKRITEVLGCTIEELNGEEPVKEKDMKRNGSGCMDPTAYQAMKNIDNRLKFKRGDIFMIKERITKDSTQYHGRPAVIVSNDIGNRHSCILEVVFLTSQKREKALPTHVPVICRVPSTALCEQVTTIGQDRVLEYVRSCTDKEMQAIDKAIMVSLGLELPLATDVPSVVRIKNQEVDKLRMELEAVEQKLNDEKITSGQLKQRLDEMRDLKAIYQKGAMTHKATMEENETLKSKLADAEAKVAVLEQQPVFPSDPEEVVRLKAQIEILEKQNERLLDRLIG